MVQLGAAFDDCEPLWPWPLTMFSFKRAGGGGRLSLFIISKEYVIILFSYNNFNLFTIYEFMKNSYKNDTNSTTISNPDSPADL